MAGNADWPLTESEPHIPGCEPTTAGILSSDAQEFRSINTSPIPTQGRNLFNLAAVSVGNLKRPGGRETFVSTTQMPCFKAMKSNPPFIDWNVWWYSLPFYYQLCKTAFCHVTCRKSLYHDTPLLRVGRHASHKGQTSVAGNVTKAQIVPRPTFSWVRLDLVRLCWLT